MTGVAISEVAQSADTSRRKFLVGATAALSAVGASWCRHTICSVLEAKCES